MVSMNPGVSKMSAADHHRLPRIDTVALKLQMEKRLGRTRLNQYLNLLKRYLCLKVAKADFDRLCIGLLGKGNLSIHNKLIQSIIKNACACMPSLRNQETENPSSNVRKHSFLHEVLSKSPKKHRTHVIRDRRLLGHQGKPQGVIISPRFQKQQSATELLSLGSKPPLEVTSVEEGEEVDQRRLSPGIHSQSPLVAPIGVSIAAKGTRKSFCHGSSPSMDVETCYNYCELPCSSLLKKRLEQAMAIGGLKLSGDCVNLLNNGLDAYIKRLLKPCIDLSASRSQLPRMPFSVSMTDFRATMESNPRVLGGDWPVLFEKVCFHGAEDHL